jgi:hypothetical protein
MHACIVQRFLHIVACSALRIKKQHTVTLNRFPLGKEETCGASILSKDFATQLNSHSAGENMSRSYSGSGGEAPQEQRPDGVLPSLRNCVWWRGVQKGRKGDVSRCGRTLTQPSRHTCVSCVRGMRNSRVVREILVPLKSRLRSCTREDRAKRSLSFTRSQSAMLSHVSCRRCSMPVKPTQTSRRSHSCCVVACRARRVSCSEITKKTKRITPNRAPRHIHKELPSINSSSAQQSAGSMLYKYMYAMCGAVTVDFAAPIAMLMMDACMHADNG